MDTKNEDYDSDVEVIADSITVNLRCPMSGSRIKHAGRFKPCLHMGCFDLDTFVELTQRTRKWQCPICLKNYCLEDIIIDPYFNQIATMMRHCGEDVTEIMVKPDGSWAAKTKGEIGDLGQWHRPDGSLFDATREVTSPLEMSRHIEKGYNLELCGSTEYGMEENTNGIVQVGKHKHTSVSSMDQLEENFGITMSRSAMGSGREEDDMSMDQRCVTDHFSPSSFIDINSISHSFDPRCGLNNSCSAPHNADIIVLSDSDEEDDNVVPGAAYGAGLVNQSSSLTAHREMANSHLKHPELYAGVRSSFGVFNNNGYDVRKHSSSYPSSIEASPIIQHLGEDTNITDSLIDLEHTSVNGSAPASGYNWASTAALSSAASIAVLDGETSTKRRSNKKFSDGPFSFPRQPRSVRKRICSKLTYF
ncbi:hypothetical protein Tsubulata_020259 [Turnera subulata]|uniref:SP-RING-type domain-containing protein n=1 Tax=Turnera subulata TaxID=218843 RepID=A0A9Q0GEW6_9ROSI|nr:hypothetical protein Tsubulata_020259 [Turnera subulata]